MDQDLPYEQFKTIEELDVLLVVGKSTGVLFHVQGSESSKIAVFGKSGVTQNCARIVTQMLKKLNTSVDDFYGSTAYH